ncbi:MAG: rhodanese-like domain-containing protein [Rhodospirillales bacterium]|nr:rhodanese-like domain-containing protein [Rhodospirillales bacterium]
MTQATRLFAFALMITAMLAAGLPVRAETVTVADPAKVRALIDQGAKVIDIRRADEWRDTGIIDGSILLTAIDADGRLVPGFPEALADVVDRNEPVVVICRSGNRSASITRMMSEGGGFTHVVDAGGGIRAWLGAGQPVAPCPSC